MRDESPIPESAGEPLQPVLHVRGAQIAHADVQALGVGVTADLTPFSMVCLMYMCRPDIRHGCCARMASALRLALCNLRSAGPRASGQQADGLLDLSSTESSIPEYTNMLGQSSRRVLKKRKLGEVLYDVTNDKRPRQCSSQTNGLVVHVGLGHHATCDNVMSNLDVGFRGEPCKCRPKLR
eukprot:1677184-Amphidinium_carterae.1